MGVSRLKDGNRESDASLASDNVILDEIGGGVWRAVKVCGSKPNGNPLLVDSTTKRHSKFALDCAQT